MFDEVEDAFGEVIAASQDLEHNGHALTPSHEREKNRKAFREALNHYADVLKEAVREDCAESFREWARDEAERTPAQED